MSEVSSAACHASPSCHTTQSSMGPAFSIRRVQNAGTNVQMAMAAPHRPAAITGRPMLQCKAFGTSCSCPAENGGLQQHAVQHAPRSSYFSSSSASSLTRASSSSLCFFSCKDIGKTHSAVCRTKCTYTPCTRHYLCRCRTRSRRAAAPAPTCPYGTHHRAAHLLRQRRPRRVLLRKAGRGCHRVGQRRALPLGPPLLALLLQGCGGWGVRGTAGQSYKRCGSYQLIV